MVAGSFERDKPGMTGVVEHFEHAHLRACSERYRKNEWRSDAGKIVLKPGLRETDFLHDRALALTLRAPDRYT
jgi:hypothetical protein